MAYHIEKQQKIQDKVDTIYYEGSYRWTTVFSDRKIYLNEEDATKDLYDFGGIVLSE